MFWRKKTKKRKPKKPKKKPNIVLLAWRYIMNTPDTDEPEYRIKPRNKK